MELDYTAGCVNFRDAGAFVNLITGKPLLPENRLLRGGKIDFVSEASEIGSPGTIINLRAAEDAKTFGADPFHFPTANNHEKYATTQREVRRWLNAIVALFEDKNLRYPVLIHCLSGKDRTGIVIAALLKILDVSDAVIVEEYLLSEGNVSAESIMQALSGIGEPAHYFNRIHLELMRRNILQMNPLNP